MACERPGGIAIDALRDSRIQFPPKLAGEIPPPATREELSEQFGPVFKSRQLSDGDVKEALDFLEGYEQRYYEVVEGERVGETFHRVCGGGAMAQGETGVFCANCGKLPDLIPPECLR